MKLARRLALIVLAAAAAVALAGTSARSAPQAAKPKLTSFGTCGQLLGYAKGQAKRFVGPYGFGSIGRPMPTEALPPVARAAAPAAPVQGVDFSGTNVQEEGVDEPDLVKTDGNTVFAVANGKLRAVDVAGAKPRLLDSLALEPGLSHELLLHGDRLLVLSRGGYWIEPLPAMAARIAPYQPSNSVLAEIDVSDPAKLRLVRTLTLDGSYVAARLVGSAARIVVAAQLPAALPFKQPTDGSPEAIAAAERQNEAVLARSKVASWLPSYRIKRAGAKPGKARPLVQCRHVRRPTAFSGLGMLTVLTVDLTKGLQPVDSAAVMTDGRIVYASPESLYVTTERWADRPDPDKPTAGAGGRADRDPQVRHLEPDEDAVPRQRQGLRLPAQPVVALRVPRRAPRRQHREPGVVGLGRRDRVVPDHAAPVGRQSRPGRAGSAASARASASTPCASPATPATSSPSARSIRSSRSTSRGPSSRACSAS